MRADRATRNLSHGELSRLVEKIWNNEQTLALVEHELERRPGAKYEAGRVQIRQRLDQLRSVGGQSQSANALISIASFLASRESSEELERIRALRDEAIRQLEWLRGEVARQTEKLSDLKRKVAADSAQKDEWLYRRVGLASNCPDVVLKAVRTAYRRHLHPDTRPAHQKGQAEEWFKEAERAFEAIYFVRGMKRGARRS